MNVLAAACIITLLFAFGFYVANIDLLKPLVIIIGVLGALVLIMMLVAGIVAYYYDKFDPANAHMVPAIIHKLHLAMLENAPDVEIWGDGTARREFMYAGDLADCIWRCLDNFYTVPQLMNVGLGTDLSVNEYYQIAADIVGFTGGFQHNLSKPVGMTRKLVSTDRATAWGWHAKTSLSDGSTKTYDFYLKECRR